MQYRWPFASSGTQSIDLIGIWFIPFAQVFSIFFFVNMKLLTLNNGQNLSPFSLFICVFFSLSEFCALGDKFVYALKRSGNDNENDSHGNCIESTSKHHCFFCFSFCQFFFLCVCMYVCARQRFLIAIVKAVDEWVYLLEFFPLRRVSLLMFCAHTSPFAASFVSLRCVRFSNVTEFIDAIYPVSFWFVQFFCIRSSFQFRYNIFVFFFLYFNGRYSLA